MGATLQRLRMNIDQGQRHNPGHPQQYIRERRVLQSLGTGPPPVSKRGGAQLGWRSVTIPRH
eukprot:1914849-Pyramimonas_sp.AAC.1